MMSRLEAFTNAAASQSFFGRKLRSALSHFASFVVASVQKALEELVSGWLSTRILIEFADIQSRQNFPHISLMQLDLAAEGKFTTDFCHIKIGRDMLIFLAFTNHYGLKPIRIDISVSNDMHDDQLRFCEISSSRIQGLRA